MSKKNSNEPWSSKNRWSHHRAGCFPTVGDRHSSRYPWQEGRGLGDRGPHLALHAVLDDATGEVIAAVFCRTETLEGYATVMIVIEALRRKGVPLSLYSDRHSIFRSPKAQLTIEQELAGRKPKDALNG